MKSLFPFSIFLLISLFVNQQSVTAQTSAGLRLGSPTSISFKHFVSDRHALEAYVGTRAYYGYRWTNVSAAYQIHKPVEAINNLSWYWGLGGSVYFWSYNGIDYRGYGNTSFGIQGYGGLDYQFEDLPINISLDWTPTFFVNGYGSGFGGGYGSLAVRYVFNR